MPAAPQLVQNGWRPEVHRALCALLADPELPGRVAAFDWDNTAIHGDVGDAAMRWQLDGLHLALPPHVLAAQWGGPIEALGRAKADPTPARALLDDVVDAYRELWPALVLQAPARVRHTPAHLDFRARLGALYELLLRAGRPHPHVVAQTFGLLAQLWGGLSERAPARCVAELVCQPAAGEPAANAWTAARPGRAGHATYAFGAGPAPFPEVRSLFAALASAGARVTVVSASFEPLVRALADAWGYPVAPEQVFGLRLAPASFPEPFRPLTFAARLAPGHPVTYRAGKVACLTQYRLQEPILVAGDALTDLEMLTHWPTARIRLLIGRPNPAEEVEALYREATDLPPASGPHTLLQR